MKTLFDTIAFYFSFAFHTLLGSRRQYVSLFTVCVAGLAIMLTSVFVTDGMLSAVDDKARIYYGGDAGVIGGVWRKTLADADGIIQILEPIVPEGTKFYKRADYDGNNATFIFEGTEMKTRMFKGVDFSVETDTFASFNFADGAPVSTPEHNGILISESVAKRLGAKKGDAVTVQLKDDIGYINTASFIVTGIFVDSSLFGMYTSYVDIQALQAVVNRGEGYVNRVCVYLPRGERLSKKLLQSMQSLLEAQYTMWPLSDDKTEFNRKLRNGEWGETPVYGLVTLEANIKELSVLTDAIRAVVLMVVVVLMTIISVGMGSTYRIVVMKRTTEIGTFRALGMRREGVRKVFLVESFCLLTAGFVVALALSLLFCGILGKFNFSFIPAFDMFLENGHLVARAGAFKALVVFFTVSVTTILSLLFTIRNVVHISPVGALATTA